MLGTKSNLPSRVLSLLVALQANYHNTLTYLQCKVLTAERNIGNIASDSGHLPAMTVSESRLLDSFTRRIQCLHAHKIKEHCVAGNRLDEYLLTSISESIAGVSKPTKETLEQTLNPIFTYITVPCLVLHADLKSRCSAYLLKGLP